MRGYYCRIQDDGQRAGIGEIEDSSRAGGADDGGRNAGYGGGVVGQG